MTSFITKEQADKADSFFWKLTKDRIAAATEPIKQDIRKIAALAATGAAFGVGGLIVAIRAFMRRH